MRILCTLSTYLQWEKEEKAGIQYGSEEDRGGRQTLGNFRNDTVKGNGLVENGSVWPVDGVSDCRQLYLMIIICYNLSEIFIKGAKRLPMANC